MTNKQIHDYLRSKRLVKKFAQFMGITEQGILYRLTKGKKSVYDDVKRFFWSSEKYIDEQDYLNSLKSNVELITERTKDLIDDKFYCPFFQRLDEYYKNNLDNLIDERLSLNNINPITEYTKRLQEDANLIIEEMFKHGCNENDFCIEHNLDGNRFKLVCRGLTPKGQEAINILNREVKNDN